MREFLSIVGFRNLVILSCLAILAGILPEAPIMTGLDISLKKIAQVVIAVSSIQIVGIFIFKKFNSHAGFLLQGAISGLISSTAFTLELARRSKSQDEESLSVSSLSFLAATLMMLVEGLILLFITATHLHWSSIVLFITPILVTLGLIVVRTVHTISRDSEVTIPTLDWGDVLKLVLFIIFILMSATAIGNHSGEFGLKILTFFMSLFELHGVVIATSQLKENQHVGLMLFNQLLLLALIGGNLSKVIIVFALGSSYLKKKVFLWSLMISLSAVIAWFII